MLSITAEVYGAIRDDDYAEAIRLLEEKLGDLPRSRSRPLLSLLAYCCYHNREFARAAELYETLTELCPESEEYQLYYVQSLLKSGSHLDASRVAASAVMNSKSLSQRMKLLQANAELEQGLLSACSTTLSQCLEEDDPETIIALATLDFRQGRFAKVLETYKLAELVMGAQPKLMYYIALCHYELSDYDAALELVHEIIDEASEEEQMESNNESYFVEATNLKAAILYTSKKYSDAKMTMEVFSENLDPVTIHNDVVVNVEEDPSIGISKLEYLLSNETFPPETLSNLLTLYTSHGQDDLFVETFERNKHLAKELLPPDVFAYFDAVMMSLTCPDSAHSVLEAQLAQFVPKLRLVKKDVSDATKSAASVRPATSHSLSSARPTTAAERKGQRAVAVATKGYEAILDRYIPMLMLQAKLYWDKKEYSRAEQLLRRSADFCRDNDAFALNLGHILFAQQDNKFESSIEQYELLLKNHAESDLLKVPAVALANLCVAYIMTNQNDAAEELIRSVEREEKQNVALGGERTNHSCIINLVIGTLYCSTGNYEFGISRICKSLEQQNLNTETFFYTKRCFLEFASKISKAKFFLNDDLLQDIFCFLDDVASFGKHIVIEESNTANSDPLEAEEPATIASEAFQLKNTFIKICA